MLRIFKKHEISESVICPSYRRLVPKVGSDDKLFNVIYVYEDFDTSIDSLDIHSEDLSLGNIIRVGANSMLKPIVMSQTSTTFDFIDSFENVHIKNEEA